jgi:membrane fusion protein (multidrug efflux system)
VAGYLIQQFYKEGSFVKKGQLLFQIDPRPFQASLASYVLNLEQEEFNIFQAASSR